MMGENLNLFLSIGGFVVGILGFVSGAIFYVKGKPKRVLRYRIKSTYIIYPLLESQLQKAPELKILFNETPISMLKSSTITFSNSGNQTISSADFAAQGQLCVKTTERFLGTEAKFHIQEDNQNSATSITLLKENLLIINFDFLKVNESLSISFLHEGTIDVLGELKSGKIAKHRELPTISDAFFLIVITSYFVTLLNWFCTLNFPIEDYQLVVLILSASMIFVYVIYLFIQMIGWLRIKIVSIVYKSRKK